ncbi:MAG TPA: NAD(P)/FAD-dependent oxidoreductase [Chitinophagaceae bacterium]|nr:NAD(P)/FAD-dependent oxidoreductase [Chitinophagaceae bacterium]
MSQPNIPDTGLPRVVVVGGGFGGLAVVRALLRSMMQVVLIDRNNYHLFQPLLYQVSTAGLEPESIAFPLRGIFRYSKDFHIRMGEASKITPEKSILETSIGPIGYDYLVMATGSDTNFFGMADIETHAIGMKSLVEAIGIRNYILRQFEQILLINDPGEIQSRLSFVVTGGGPTGVELSGAIAELKKHVLPRDYPELPIHQMTVYLVEASSRLLASLSEQSSRYALASLQKLGVKVMLQTSVKGYDGNTLLLSSGETIRTHSLIWTAGVRGVPVPGLPGSSVLKNGRVQVNIYNQVEGFDHLFVVGDIAQQVFDPRFPKGFPMVAQVAIQQGRLAAKNIMRLQSRLPLIPFRYSDKGSMSTIGRNKAVAETAGLRFSGFPAWLAWMGAHLVFLMGFRNKLIVFINWVYRYFNFDNGSRIIFRRWVSPMDKPSQPGNEEVK